MSTFVDKSIPGGVVHNPASAYAREMAKWEMRYSPYGPPGRPIESVGVQEWPARYYKMSRSKTNGDFIVEHDTDAGSENEARNLENQGYRRGRLAAEQFVVECEQRIAVAAAERAFSDRKMGEKARAEAAAADDASAQHVAEVPVTPIKRRPGRPAKVTQESGL